MIPYGRQDINEDDIAAVVDVLRSERITQGQAVVAFEQNLCALTGAQYAVSTNSATSALHLACLVLGVGPGDRVWTSPNTYVATANCARMVGADVDFVDIDPATGNLSAQALLHKLQTSDQKPAVVIAVHFAGQSCDMQSIKQLSLQYGFKLIEDASHALGARYEHTAVGSCEYSDITVFSFHPVKIATTGEGGALLCNDEGLAKHAEQLRSHGVTRDPERRTHRDAESWTYEQQELGFNYRLTDMQAALGSSQLNRLKQFVKVRQTIASRYMDAFSEQGIGFLPAGPDSSVHLFVLQLVATRREAVFNHLQAKDIGVNVHYMPVYWQPYYAQMGFVKGCCPAAEAYYQQAISLPVYPSLREGQQRYVIEQVIAAVNRG